MTPRPRWVHVAVLVLALGGALALSERSTGFTVDEGSYAIQAHALRDGSWEIDWPFRSLDPEGEHFPYHAGRVTDDGEYAYVSHPAWPIALSWVTRALPESVGLRALSMLGVVGAALAGGALARRLGGDGAWVWGFWVAAASPLFANGLMVWAHAPAAALAGWALLAALALLEPGAPRAWQLVLVGAVAGGVMLRSESLLFAGALALGLAIWSWRRSESSAWKHAVQVVGAAGMGVALERGIVRLVAEEASGARLTARESEGGWLSGRIDGFGTALLDGARSSGGAALCSLLVLALAAGAAVAIARGREDLRPTPLLWVAVALTVVRLVAWPDDVVPGLLTAFPVAAVALAVWRGAEVRVVLVAGITGLFAAVVVATQYSDGGGLQWGGRFFAPAIVPLAALVGVAVVRHLPVTARVPLGLLVATGALMGVWTTDQVRQDNAAGIAAVADVDSPTVLVAGDQLARLDWEAWPERCWVAGDPADAASAIRLLEEAGPGRSAFLGYSQEELEAGGAREVQPLVDGAGVGSLERDAEPRACPGANMRSQVVGGR